jgi:hypothetical protein
LPGFGTVSSQSSEAPLPGIIPSAMYFADRGLKGLQPGRDVLLVLTDS